MEMELSLSLLYKYSKDINVIIEDILGEMCRVPHRRLWSVIFTSQQGNLVDPLQAEYTSVDWGLAGN